MHAARTCHSEMSQLPRWETGLESANDVTHPKRSRRILGILKKVSWVENLDSEREGSAFARSLKTGLWPCSGCHTCCGGRWKSQHRMIVPLFPYVEKPFNSKEIKSFVPELRIRKYFSCFGIPMFYVYMLWTFYVRFTYPYLAM